MRVLHNKAHDHNRRHVSVGDQALSRERQLERVGHLVDCGLSTLESGKNKEVCISNSKREDGGENVPHWHGVSVRFSLLNIASHLLFVLEKRKAFHHTSEFQRDDT